MLQSFIEFLKYYYSNMRLGLPCKLEALLMSSFREIHEQKGQHEARRMPLLLTCQCQLRDVGTALEPSPATLPSTSADGPNARNLQASRCAAPTRRLRRSPASCSAAVGFLPFGLKFDLQFFVGHSVVLSTERRIGCAIQHGCIVVTYSHCLHMYFRRMTLGHKGGTVALN